MLGNSHSGAYDKDRIDIREEEKGNHSEERWEEEGGAYRRERDIDPPQIPEKEEVLKGEVVPNNRGPKTGGYPAPTFSPANPGNIRVREMDDRGRALRKCNQCSLEGTCPKYSPGSNCAYGLGPETESPNPADVPARIQEIRADILEWQYDRVAQGVLEERVDAAGFNKDTTKNMELLHKMLIENEQIFNPQPELHLKAKGTGALDLFRPKTRDP